MLVYNLYVQMTPDEECPETESNFEGTFSSLERAKDYVRTYYGVGGLFYEIIEISIVEQELDDPIKPHPQWIYVFEAGKVVRAFKGRWDVDVSDTPKEF